MDVVKKCAVLREYVQLEAAITRGKASQFQSHSNHQSNSLVENKLFLNSDTRQLFWQSSSSDLNLIKYLSILLACKVYGSTAPCLLKK